MGVVCVSGAVVLLYRSFLSAPGLVIAISPITFQNLSCTFFQLYGGITETAKILDFALNVIVFYLVLFGKNRNNLN